MTFANYRSCLKCNSVLFKSVKCNSRLFYMSVYRILPGPLLTHNLFCVERVDAYVWFRCCKQFFLINFEMASFMQKGTVGHIIGLISKPRTVHFFRKPLFDMEGIFVAMCTFCQNNVPIRQS